MAADLVCLHDNNRSGDRKPQVTHKGDIGEQFVALSADWPEEPPPVTTCLQLLGECDGAVGKSLQQFAQKNKELFNKIALKGEIQLASPPAPGKVRNAYACKDCEVALDFEIPATWKLAKPVTRAWVRLQQEGFILSDSLDN